MSVFAMRAGLAKAIGARAGWLASAAAIAAAALAIVALGGPASAPAQSCGPLPVKATVVGKFSRNYALQYRKRVPIQVTTKGPRITGWKVQIYTFGGFRLGHSKRYSVLGGTRHTKVPLKFPMQPGQFTVVVKGTVAGCGELELDKVVKFRDCVNKLPVHFPDKPRGFAADYGHYVSLKIEPTKNHVIKKLRGRLYNFHGKRFGSSRLHILFGTQFMNNLLSRTLVRGNYTFIVSGLVDQPRACGPKSKQVVLRFR
jgi:hypothetical protein